MKKSLVNLLKKSITARHLLRFWRLKFAQPSWNEIFADERLLWQDALSAPKKKRVLIATSIGAHLPSVILESLLSAALTLRDAEVHVLLCDKVLPACMDCSIDITIREKELAKHGPQKNLCASCYKYTNGMFRSLGVQVHRYSDFLSPDDFSRAQSIASEIDLSNLKEYALDGIAVGEHALAGALRFYARGDLEKEVHATTIAGRYLRAALLTMWAVRRLLNSHTFDAAVFHHGIYVPQGLVGEVCRSKKLRVVNWNVAYKKSCFIFSHGDTYHHTLMGEDVKHWESVSLNKDREAELMDYLKSRWYGSKDWIWFHEKPRENLAEIAKEIGVDFSKPCVGLLTNVMWDAQLHYPANAFPNMLEWVVATIEYFRKRTDIQLVIRVHPAEIWGKNPSRQKLVDEINARFESLPANVFIIAPEARISTYAVMEQCDSVIIYGTKTGVELTSMGIPVIVAGEAWVRNKGITLDASSPEHYFKILDTLPLGKRLDESVMVRARKYAFHFFFRRMIPLPFMKPVKGWPLYSIGIRSLSELRAGNFKGLDVICDGILKNTPFIYPHENS
jgi:hypothetical protein